jgi:hypothetical protein
MKQIPLRIYLLRYLVIRAAMGTLTTTIYEIVIKLVKLQTDYRYPNSHFFPSTTKLWNYPQDQDGL